AGPEPGWVVWEEWQRRREGVAAWVVLVQHVHHGDDHRAQIGTVLGAARVEPENLSARVFISTPPRPPDGAAAGPWAHALLERFFDRSGWAPRTLLEHCLSLGAEALAAPIAGTYGTVHETLTRLVDADGDYLGWLTGGEEVLLEGAAEPEVL